MYHARLISPLFKNHFLKQSIFFLIGLSLIYLKDKIKINWLFDYSNILYLLNCILLIAVLFLGETTNGAKAWFKLGFFSFQPSELMKLSLALYLSQITDNHPFQSLKNELIYLSKIFIIVVIPSILVFLEPDTGAIIFYCVIALAIALSSKLSKKWFFFLFGVLTILIIGFFYAYYFHQDFLISFMGTSFFYRVERLLNFQKGLQIDHALIAIGSAPLFQFNLNQPGIYIPEAPTDFVFALTSNVLGILGLFTILICYFFIDIYLFKQWHQEKKQKKKYFLAGFEMMFFLNQFYNILMNIGLIPIMGIPLPFLSYGGSTTIVYFLFLMIILKTEAPKKRKKKRRKYLLIEMNYNYKTYWYMV